MVQIEAYLLTFLTVLVGHVKSEFCYRDFGADLYCYNGCCGTRPSQYCCDYSVSYITYSGGAIAGIVVGCLVGLGLLIGTILCYCSYQRRRATNGQILHAQANPGFTVTTGTTTITGTQMQTTQMPPGMYAPSYAPQMASGYTPYMPHNAAMNNPYSTAPPAYDQAAKN